MIWSTKQKGFHQYYTHSPAMPYRESDTRRFCTHKYKANLVNFVKFTLNSKITLKHCRINHTWNDWQHEDKSIVLKTNPSSFISLEDATYIASVQLGKRVGRTAVTAWVRKNSLGVKVGERYGGYWLIRRDLFKECLVQKRNKRFSSTFLWLLPARLNYKDCQW